MNYAEHAIVRDETLDYTHYPLEHDFPLDEYRLRVARARAEMARAGLDALIITSGQVGWWFTGRDEPHSWHDRVPSRSTWYILTPDHDYLYMTPTNNHNFASARRGTWVSEVREIVERTEWPWVEIWGLAQMPGIFADLGLLRSRLGFELGDTMTLGLCVNDFLRLRELMSTAALVDASPVIRRWYRITWECNRAMAGLIRPGTRCSDVYAGSMEVERKFGLVPGRSGRRGHGLRNTGGLSVHPDNHTVLEPGMILSVEPMFGNRYGFYDLEDQYVVTERGTECLHEPAPEELPVVGG